MAEFSDVSKNYSDGEKQVTAKVFFSGDTKFIKRKR